MTEGKTGVRLRVLSTFVAFMFAALGARLWFVQVLNATVFLGLDQKWQYIFQGLLIVAAAIIYSQVRRRATRAPGQAVTT